MGEGGEEGLAFGVSFWKGGVAKERQEWRQDVEREHRSDTSGHETEEEEEE